MATVLKTVTSKWNSRQLANIAKPMFSSGSNLLTDAVAGFSSATSDDPTYLTGKGTGYLHVSVPGNQSDTYGLISLNPTDPFAVTPGVEYTFSTYIGSQNYDPEISLNVVWRTADDSGQSTSSSPYYAVLPTDNDRVTLTATCPVGYTKASLEISYKNVVGRPAFKINNSGAVSAAPTQDIRIRIIGGVGIIDPHDIRVVYSGVSYVPLIMDVYYARFELGNTAGTAPGYIGTGIFNWKNNSVSRSSKTLTWNSNSYLRNSARLNWQVLGNGAGAVRLSKTVKWNDLVTLRAPFVLSWQDLTRAATTKTLKWNENGYATKASVYIWKDLTKVTQTRQLNWNDSFAQYIRGAFNLLWSDKATLASTKTVKWNDTTKVATTFRSLVWSNNSRVSATTKTVKWNDKARVLKSQSYQWNSARTLKKSPVLKWNDQAVLRKVENFAWKDLNRIPASKTLRYNGRRVVTNSTALPWSIRASANTKTTILNWVIRTKVSQPTGLQWSDLQRVSNVSKTLRWNSTRSVGKTTRLNWRFKSKLGYGVKAKPFERVTISATAYRRIR